MFEFDEILLGANHQPFQLKRPQKMSEDGAARPVVTTALTFSSLSRSFLDIAMALVLNIGSSVGTVFLNKYLFKFLDFPFGMTLTALHMISNFLLLCMCGFAFNMFEVKRLDFVKVLPISFVFCGFVVFSNISLVYNSITFYQFSKVLNTPVIIIIEAYFYSKYISRYTAASLIVTCLGVLIGLAHDLEMNARGIIYALVAVVFNSVYTIFGKSMQQQLQANAMQLLMYQSMQSSLMLIICVPLFDDVQKLKAYDWKNLDHVAFIGVSCLTAFAVNLSFYMLVGKTSALTYVAVICVM